MRLWHIDLVSKLPRQQLLGQHRECCALRGNGWGRKHSTVDYVFKYSFTSLVIYHRKVMDEMIKRGYKPDTMWMYLNYRGKNCDWINPHINEDYIERYPEHNDEYYQECIDNLRAKGIEIQ